MFFFSIALGAISDCNNIISLATGLNLHVVNQTRMSILNQDCCLDAGVTCSVGKVTKVAWNSMNLNGTLNMSSIPNSLGDLELSSNKIGGQVDKIPLSMTEVDLSRNLLNGTLPVPIQYQFRYNTANNGFEGLIPTFKNSFQSLFVDFNKLSGEFKIFDDPSLTVNILFINNNQFTGSLSISCVQNSIRGLNNLFTELVDQELPKTRSIYLNNNLFMGTFPSYAPVLNTLRIQNNQFSGQLFLNAPIDININENLFQDISINETTLLTPSNCLLSNNPLLNSPNIQNLTMCNQTGIYELLESSSIASTMVSIRETLASSSESTLAVKIFKTRLPVLSSTSLAQFTSFVVKSTVITQSTATQYTETYQVTTTISIEGKFTPILTQVLRIFPILKLTIDFGVLVYLLVKLIKRQVHKRTPRQMRINYDSNL